MRRIFVRDEDPSAAIAAQLQALGTKYPRKKTRIDNAPKLCGIALVWQYLARSRRIADCQRQSLHILG